jgi:hypothetical protein
MSKYDPLERRIVETIIEVFDNPSIDEAREAHETLIKLIAKYRARLGEDSYMQRQYDKGITYD